MPPLLLALALVGGWDYAGFVDEPGRSAPAPAPSPSPTPDRKPGRIDDAIFPPARPKPATPATPAAPTVHQRADAWGRMWQHSDLAYLESCIRAINAGQAIPHPPAATQPAPPATPCSGGSCPPRR